MENSLIRVENLCKSYDGDGVKTLAVCGVSFSIEKGEFVAIMGPSGSGKSTMMQILGLLDSQTDGDYFLDGKDVRDFSDDEKATIRNEKIGFVFQMFNLLPRTTVFENVELPLLYSHQENYNQGEIKKMIDGALESVSMSHRTNHFSNQLSGGEKQRVAIARALVNQPEIIFADEPTGNLDSKSGIEVMKILQELNQRGKTIILVTHETYTAEHAKRIIRMRDGKIESDEVLVNGRRRIAQDGEMLK